MKIKELGEKVEELDTNINNGSQIEAKNLQEKDEEVIKVQENVS